MRNALLVSLGSMDAETAARKGAFSILTQLVDGGILLSLSTTIVGGIGGYFMRMIKAWTAGPGSTLFLKVNRSSSTGSFLTGWIVLQIFLKTIDRRLLLHDA